MSIKNEKELPVYWKGVLIGYTEDKLSIRIVNESAWREMLKENWETFSLISSSSKSIEKFYNILPIEEPENPEGIRNTSVFVGHNCNHNFLLMNYSESNKYSYLKTYKKLEKAKGKDETNQYAWRNILQTLNKESRENFIKTMKYELPLYKKLLIRVKDKLRIWKQDRHTKKMLK